MTAYNRAIILAAFIVTCILVLRSSYASTLSRNSHWSGDEDAQGPVDQTTHARLAKQLSAAFPYDPTPDFPAHIWQTWKTSPQDQDFDRSLFAAQASWGKVNPDVEHQVLNDSHAASLVHDVYAKIPKIQQAYDALPEPVLKADFFRYLILLARGGVYSDIDTTALKPTSQWVPSEVPTSSYGLVVGIEADPDREDWQEWYARRIQFCQWTIQSKPGHPVLVDIVTSITTETLQRQRLGELDKMHMKSVMEFTGPGIWTDAVFHHFDHDPSLKGEITWHTFVNLTQSLKVADVVVLPITSFSPGVGHMGSMSSSDPMAFVSHAFKGESDCDTH